MSFTTFNNLQKSILISTNKISDETKIRSYDYDSRDQKLSGTQQVA